MAEEAATIMGYVFCLPLVILSYMNSIKRAHDLDKPGWIVIGFLIPVVDIILAIYLLFFKGTDGPNQYGDDPLRF